MVTPGSTTSPRGTFVQNLKNVLKVFLVCASDTWCPVNDTIILASVFCFFYAKNERKSIRSHEHKGPKLKVTLDLRGGTRSPPRAS